jgi:hypothetical protein
MWWKQVEKITPAGTSRSDVFGSQFGPVAWTVAGLAALFTLLLLIDAILSWERNKRRSNPGGKARFVYFKRFLGWLFYPSFQAYFRSED